MDADLIAEQLRHTIDLLRAESKERELALESEIALLKAELRRVEDGQKHLVEMTDTRVRRLEGQTEDHENRIRAATDGVTQFKVWSGLISGGSSLVSVVALVKAWLGG